MRFIEYQTPTSIGTAVALLAENGRRARPLAGGTVLLKQLDHELDVDMVVDVNKIPELNVLQFDPDDGLTIGAAVPWCHLCDCPRVKALYPCLALVAWLIRSIPVEGRATLGGNLCTAPTSSDGIPALIAMNATCRIAGPRGYRTVPVEQLWTAPQRNALDRGEMLVSIHLPLPRPHSGAWYIPFHPDADMDLVYVRVAASLELSEDNTKICGARIALGAAAPTPLSLDTLSAALNGQPPSEAVLDRAALVACAAAWPAAEARGDAVKRARVAGLLTRRALRFALARAQKRRTIHVTSP